MADQPELYANKKLTINAARQTDTQPNLRTISQPISVGKPDITAAICSMLHNPTLPLYNKQHHV